MTPDQILQHLDKLDACAARAIAHNERTTKGLPVHVRAETLISLLALARRVAGREKLEN